MGVLMDFIYSNLCFDNDSESDPDVVFDKNIIFSAFCLMSFFFLGGGAFFFQMLIKKN